MKSLLSKFHSLNLLYLATILFIITFATYANTFSNGLFFDDEQFIYNNQAVQDFSVSEFFSRSLITESGRLSNYYRPLLFFTFGVEYQLVGDHGFLYHFDSMMIHIAGGILLFLFLEKLFSKRLFAFLVSLLWLIHPIQTEAVSYVSGRGDLLSFFFVILTLYLSLFKSKKTFYLSLFTLVFALLSKEVAMITPGLIFITTHIKQKQLSIRSLWKSFLITLPYIIITLIYFLLRITILDFSNTLNFYDSKNIYTESLFVRLNTFFHILPEYLKLLFYPKDLFMERDLSISVQTNLTIQSIVSFISIIFLFLVGVKWYKKSPLILFSLCWFIISFVPTSGIIPINGIFYEHFLYYPSIGIFLLVCLLISFLIKRFPQSRIFFTVLLSCVLVLLSLRTITRNNDWHDPITFYESTNTYVQSARIYNNLAMSYADNKNFQKAIPMYEKAINLADAYPQTHFNLANAYLENKNYKKAEEEYKKAIRLDPLFYRSYIQLFSLYKITNNEDGITWVKQNLLDLSKRQPEFHQLIELLEKQN